VTVPRALIAETIDIVAVLSGRGAERRLAEVAHVDGLDPVTGDYRTLNALLPSPHAAKGDSE
jgi:type IV secretion system protein VirB11